MFKFILSLLFSVQISAFAAIEETPNLAACLKSAANNTTGLAAKDVLYVFDIDNTVLALNQNFGSVQWFRWQRELIQNNVNENQVAQTIDELLDKQRTIYQLSKSHTPEATMTLDLLSLQEKGHHLLFHTSRNLDVRDITERELKANNLLPLINTIGPRNGYAGSFKFQNVVPDQRPVSFQNGIYMSAGQDKGVWLHLLLEKTKTQPKHIVFVDDELKNLQNVEKEFRPILPTTLCRYAKMDSVVHEFVAGHKTTEIMLWKSLESFMTQLH